MDHDDRFPDEVLLHFIERLPTTIRDIVLARCCKAFGRLQLIPNQDLFATFRAILREAEDEARAYSCAKMIAVVELALQDDGWRCEAAFDRDLCEATGARRFSTIDLQAPLAQKLWQAAQNEFTALRGGPLSIGSLQNMLGNESEERPHVRAAPREVHNGQRESVRGNGR